MLRIEGVEPLEGFRLQLTLSNGDVIERDVEPLLRGALFAQLRHDLGAFRQVFAANDSVAWPNGADLCPDVLIWGGPPPFDPNSMPPTTLELAATVGAP